MRAGPWKSLTLLAALALLHGLAAPAFADGEEVPGATASGTTASGTTAPAGTPPGGTAPVTPQANEAAPPVEFTSSRNIEDKLDEARQLRRSLFDFGIREAALRLEERFYRKTRIRFATMYTYLSQRASTGEGPRDAAGGDLDFIATWDAVQRRGKTVGALDVSFEGRHKSWTPIPPASLSNTIDSLWTTTSGFNTQDFFPVQLYWRQALLGGRLRMRAGKLSAHPTFFGNRLNSSSLFFVNFAFADNPTVFMPGNGLGVHASYDLSRNWTAHVGVQNANAIKTRFDAATLDLGQLWYAGQIDYRTDIRGPGQGTWRLGGWFVNARPQVGASMGGGGVLSIDQQLGKRVIGFLRAEWQGRELLNPEVAFDALTATRSSVRAGAGIPGPFRSLPDDYMGLGLAWGDPAERESILKDTWVAEYFYRFQLETAAQLSLSLQTIRSSTIFKRVFVLSVRLRFEF